MRKRVRWNDPAFGVEWSQMPALISERDKNYPGHIKYLVLAERGDMLLLGVRTIEGFGVMIDNISHRFVATTTLVA